MGTITQAATEANYSNISTANPSNDTDLALMMDFVEWVFGLSAEHLPNESAVERRAKSWLRLLTPHFFQKEVSYVVQVCCRLRGDRKDAIKADEILRIAEKVYGCPVASWGNPEFHRFPEVWSTTDNDWIPLSQAVERLWKVISGNVNTNFDSFEQAQPQLLEMIYGGNE